jgi:hypothetical protein
LVLSVLPSGLPGHCFVAAALARLVSYALIGRLVLRALVCAKIGALIFAALLAALHTVLRSAAAALLLLLALLRQGYAACGKQRNCGNARQQHVLLRPH